MSFVVRKLNRARGWNYSSNGKYFITLCVKDRCISFGRVVNHKVVLNGFGLLVKKCWLNMPSYYTNLKLDEFVIMPDHMHGIVEVFGMKKLSEIDRSKMYLSKSIRGFKISVTKLLNRKIWKESYFDKIIRDKQALEVIRKYIRDNPTNFDSVLN